MILLLITSIVLLILCLGLLDVSENYLAIYVSGISSIGAVCTVLFNVYLHSTERRNKKVKIDIVNNQPIYNKTEEQWLSLRIQNYGEVSAFNPFLVLQIIHEGGVEVVYRKGYAYKMHPNHDFTFTFPDNMPSINTGTKLKAIVEYTNENTKRNEKTTIPFTVSDVKVVDSMSGETNETSMLQPSCVEFNSYNDVILK